MAAAATAAATTLDESWPAEDSATLPPDGVVGAVVARIPSPSDVANETAVIFDSVPLLMFGATTADATVTIVDLGETVAAVGAAVAAAVTDETAEMVLATVCLCGGDDGLSIGL